MGIQRRTKSLDAVLSAFGDSNEALSARMLLDRLGEGVNKTTVYRLLDRLEDDGIVHSFAGEDSVTYYAKCRTCSGPAHTHNHPHFHCTSCNTVRCLEDEVSLTVSGGFQVMEAQVLLKGRCAACS